MFAAAATLAAGQEAPADGEGEPPAAHGPPPDPETAPEIRIESFARGLTAPVFLAEPDDGSGRRFIVDQDGEIFIVDTEGRRLGEPFLDLGDELVELEAEYDERGLLGLAFHPEYAENGRFFVYYSAPLHEQGPEDWDHSSHVSEFRADPDDPDRADPDSERVVLRVDQPVSNHNGGHIQFGEEGMLYIPLGDGGDGGDTDPEGEDLGRPEEGNAQTLSTLLGSVLRIDVDGDRPYAVPDDNPFVGEDGRDEIWAYGLRNPYGFSRDLETGDFYVTDAGQALFEEIDVLERGGNFGWNIKEGTRCFDPDNFLEPPEDCPETGERGEPLIDPILDYRRAPDAGSVIVPAVRYRGEAMPEYRGRLFFGDYARIRFVPQGVVYMAEEPDEEGELWPMEEVRVGGESDGRDDGVLNRFMLGVMQDNEGELYLLTTDKGGPEADTGEVFTVHSASADEDPGAAWWPYVALGAGAILLLSVAGSVAWRRRRGA